MFDTLMGGDDDDAVGEESGESGEDESGEDDDDRSDEDDEDASDSASDSEDPSGIDPMDDDEVHEEAAMAGGDEDEDEEDLEERHAPGRHRGRRDDVVDARGEYAEHVDEDEDEDEDDPAARPADGEMDDVEEDEEEPDDVEGDEDVIHMGDDDEESDGVEDEEWEEADGVSLGMGLDGMDQDPMGFRHGAFAVDDDGEAPDVEGADDDEPLDGEGEDAERRAADHLAGRLQGIIAEARSRGGEEPVVELRMGGAKRTRSTCARLSRGTAGPRFSAGAAPFDGGGAGIRSARAGRRRRARPRARRDPERHLALRRSLGRRAARRRGRRGRPRAGPRGGERCRERPPPLRVRVQRDVGIPRPTPPSPGPPRTPCCSARGSATRCSRGPRRRRRDAAATGAGAGGPSAPLSAGGADRPRGGPQTASLQSVLASISGEMSRLAVAPGGGDFRGAARRARGARVRTDSGFVVLPEVESLGSLLRIERASDRHSDGRARQRAGFPGEMGRRGLSVSDARVATWRDVAALGPNEESPAHFAPLAAVTLEEVLETVLSKPPSAASGAGPAAKTKKAAAGEKTAELASELRDAEMAPRDGAGAGATAPVSEPPAARPEPPVAEPQAAAAPPPRGRARDCRRRARRAPPREVEPTPASPEEADSEFPNAPPSRCAASWSSTAPSRVSTARRSRSGGKAAPPPPSTRATRAHAADAADPESPGMKHGRGNGVPRRLPRTCRRRCSSSRPGRQRRARERTRAGPPRRRG